MPNFYYVIYLGFGRKDIVECLLAAGANIHARDEGGVSNEILTSNSCF